MFSTVIIIILGFTIGWLIYCVVDQRSEIEMLNSIRESQNNMIDIQKNMIKNKSKLINTQRDHIRILEVMNKMIEIDCNKCENCTGNECLKYGKDAEVAVKKCADDCFKNYKLKGSMK